MFDTFTKKCTRNYTAAYTIRSSALLVISSFLSPSQNVKTIFHFLFFLKWRNESNVFCYIKILLESKVKGFDFDLHCTSSYFIFNSNCNFSFSISMRSSIFLCFSFSPSSNSNLIFHILFFSQQSIFSF